MQLLAENIFPSAASKSYFADDLGGSLEVVANYDYIQINASAKPSEFATLVQTLAQAVSNPSIDRETTAALKKALSEKLSSLEKDPVYVANQAAAKRLFGSFPYGRPQMGSVETLTHIDFADLQFAKERFLSADNATVAISGNFNSDLGFRAARRYFGAWLKSDKRVPATFRQPDAPDTRPIEVNLAGASPRTSFVLRGLARNDPDYAASLVLENVLRARMHKIDVDAAVSHSARLLPGVVVINVPGALSFPFNSFGDRVAENEFIRARADVAAELAKKSLLDRWLDADTYKTTAAGDEQAFQSVTLVDVQRVADRLAKSPIVAVVLRSAPPAR
jgi:predicted Zn-dependent peptidase